MRDVPEALATRIESGAAQLCHAWIVTLTDGGRLGFTDHDRDLEIDGLPFLAASGVVGSESVSTQGLAVSGTEVSGALSAATLTEADLAAGRFDGAEVDHLLIDWTAPDNHMLLRRAILGEVRREGGAFTAELRALTDALNQTRGRLFGALCDADLGDARCGVDLTFPAHRAEVNVVAVEGPLRLVVSGLAGHAEGAFSQGRLAFSAGPNAGVSLEVRSHLRESGTDILELWQRPPETVMAGDAAQVTAGCDKRFSTCRARFANGVNFRGHPHMPGNDFLLTIAVPGEGGYDGGSLS